MLSSASATSGRFEVPQDSFDALAEEQRVPVHRVDFREAFPALFEGSARMPRVLSQAWRGAADETMEKDKGVYTFRGGSTVDFLFHTLPESAGRARLAEMQKSIARLLAPEAARTEKAAQKALSAEAQLESDFARVLREGLYSNPGDEVVRLWCARVMHELLYSNRKVPLLPDMLRLVAGAEAAYVPFLDAETGKVAGSACRIACAAPVSAYNTGETMRQDLAALFCAAVQLYFLQGRGQQGIVVVPVRLSTVGDGAIADLYRVFLSRLAPEVASNVMLEFCGLPQDGYMAGSAETIQDIANAVRGYMFDTGVLLRRDFLADFPALHACGFSLTEKNVPTAAKRHADFYGNIGIKTYAKDARTEKDRAFAQSLDMTYIFGEAVGALQKNAFAQQK